jgi:deoxycytidylate deaminase
VLTFGQMTRKVFIESDFFICNDKKKDELRRQLMRFLEIIFDTNVHTPTLDESAMYEAYSASTGSACMSRQVGAAIVSDGRELISIGWNDVPKFGGGLYSEDDQAVYDEQKKSIDDKDHRCFKWEMKICHNEVRRNGILDDVAKKILDSKLLTKGVNLG